MVRIGRMPYASASYSVNLVVLHVDLSDYSSAGGLLKAGLSNDRA